MPPTHPLPSLRAWLGLGYHRPWALALSLLTCSACADPHPEAPPEDPCAALACYRGVCTATAGAARCLCERGWAGATCRDCAEGHVARDGACVAVVPCAGPCTNGLCVLSGDLPRCLCDAGWAGAACDRCAPGYRADGAGCVPLGEDPCAPDPCPTGRTCVPVAIGSGSGAGDYRCD